MNTATHTATPMKHDDGPGSSGPSAHPARRRLRAVLAGGLVLGVGAAVTLAAWNDSEFAIGSFAAGQFDLVGSTDGTSFTDHATADTAAPLGFTVNPTNLAPGDVVFAPFAVALEEAATYAAAVTVSAGPVAGSLSGVTYELLRTSTFGCTADTTGTSLVPAGTALGTVPADTTFDLAEPTDGLAPVNLCFKVTAGAITQGADGSAVWEFAAVSQS